MAKSEKAQDKCNRTGPKENIKIPKKSKNQKIKKKKRQKAK